MSSHTSTTYPRNVAHVTQPVFRLYLVDATTGDLIQGPIPWEPFCAALCALCEQVGNISAEFEAVDDESIALFWQPAEIE